MKGINARTLPIAGQNPFNSARAPSAAMVFRAQSIKPWYIPSGAVCILDLITCSFDELS